MRKQFLLISAVMTVTACASQPTEIPAQYVSEVQYQSYDCDQLSSESRRVADKTQSLYQSVKDKADTDAVQMGVGLLLFWPTLFFLEGGDGPEAAEYARLKGEADAIERSAISKKCSNRMQRWEPPSS